MASVDVKSKAIYVLSGTLKHNRPGVQSFLENHGVSGLTSLLTSANGDDWASVVLKTAFMLTHMVADWSDIQMKQLILDACPQLVDTIVTLLRQFSEHEDVNAELLDLVVLFESAWSQEQRAELITLMGDREQAFGDAVVSDELRQRFLQ
jgi:hypothetical protein